MSKDLTSAVPENYHTQHSPLGAFASFCVGLVDSPGGFGQSRRGPGKQNVYVGFRHKGQQWRMLPFFSKPQTSQAGAYTGEFEAAQAEPLLPWKKLTPAEYQRELAWASDEWTVEGFTFGLRSP